MTLRQGKTQASVFVASRRQLNVFGLVNNPCGPHAQDSFSQSVDMRGRLSSGKASFETSLSILTN